MALQTRGMERLEARKANPRACRRFRFAVLIGLAPHLAIAALAVLSYATARNDEEREFAIMAVFLELPLAPSALVLAVVLTIAKRTRSWAKGLIVGTGQGLIVVVLLIVWHSHARGR
jgi:hypothetical protein